jgi:hypothetical protein
MLGQLPARHWMHSHQAIKLQKLQRLEHLKISRHHKLHASRSNEKGGRWLSHPCSELVQQSHQLPLVHKSHTLADSPILWLETGHGEEIMPIKLIVAEAVTLS